MRHKVFGRKLNRDVKERKALFRSLVQALVTYGRIETTLAKAKAIRGLIEKLVTKAKDNTNSSVIQVSSFLLRKDLIDKMMKEIGPMFEGKNGGYVRILKMGKRVSDSTEKAVLEWTVKPEPVKPAEKTKSSDKKSKSKPEVVVKKEKDKKKDKKTK